MSTKSTIFLTKDNEHCYSDCSEPRFDEEKKYIGDDIFIEFDNKNIFFEKDPDGHIIIQIKAGTEMHFQISKLYALNN